MRDSDIETLDKIADALEKYLPISEYELFTEYLVVYEYVKDKRERQKASYQKQYNEKKKKQRASNQEEK